MVSTNCHNSRMNKHEGLNGGASPCQTDAALVGAYRKEKPRKPPVCWRCNEVRHVQVTVRRGHNAKTAEEKSSDSDSEYEGAFAASRSLHQVNNFNWLVDSEASSHITSQTRRLTYRKKLDLVTVGLGSSDVQRIICT